MGLTPKSTCIPSFWVPIIHNNDLLLDQLDLPIPPLSARDLSFDVSHSAPGGLIIAASYVSKTTAQLESLVTGRSNMLRKIELDVGAKLDSPQTSQQTVLEAANLAGTHILNGEDVLIMTSRKLIVGNDELSSLKIGSVVAEALVAFLGFLIQRSHYIIVKGGITSSDAATEGLMLKRAKIKGQAAPGVPLLQCSKSTCKYRDITYVVFPGNVGNNDTLRDLIARWAKLTARHEASLVSMQYQKLGTSGLQVSRMILGCMTFGNPKWEGSPWVLSESEALPLLKKAYDVGINTWETANTYSNGQSETLIGKALAMYKIPRSKVVIMTKLYYPVLEGEPDARPQPAINDGELVN